VAKPSPSEHDALDELIRAWQAARPGLDASHLGTIGRISRIDALVHQRVERWLAPYGLSWDMFDVLATLRRQPPPHEMRAGALAAWCLLSTGAMTKRIDRVEKAGLAVRVSDPTDRRAQLIRLTERGIEVADRAIAAHFRNAHQLVAPLAPNEAATLARLLRKLLRSVELTLLH